MKWFLKNKNWVLVVLVLVLAFEIWRGFNETGYDDERVLKNKGDTDVYLKLESELSELKEDEVLIFKNFENKKYDIERIKAADLQHFADSLYNKPWPSSAR